jgi:hypothetical protein
MACDGQSTWHEWEWTDTHPDFWKENQKERELLRDLSVDGRCYGGQDWQCTYNRNIESRSCKCYSEKAINITYYECLFEASGIQDAMRMHHIVVYGLSGCIVFFRVILSTERFFREKNIERKMCILIFFTTFVWNNSHSKKNWARNDQTCILVSM